MIAFTVAFVFSLLFYLTLTAGSGPLLFWSAEEIFFGIAASVPIAVLAKKLMKTTGFKPGLGWLNPARWVIFLAYIFGPFLFNLGIGLADCTGHAKGRGKLCFNFVTLFLSLYATL